MNGGRRFFRSGEAAGRAGVSADTLRHYERRGLIPVPPRSANGYRIYPSEVVAAVRIVRRALAVGFTLSELAAQFRVRARGGHPCLEVRNLAQVKLRLLEERLKMMRRLRSDLRRLLTGLGSPAQGDAARQTAYLLASLGAGRSVRHRLHTPFTTFKKK